MQNKKVFLDTNIAVDIIDISRKGHGDALELLKKLILNSYEIYISEDMLSTLYYILNDKESTLQFFQEVVFVDWNVLAFGNSVLKNATKLSYEKKFDFEDMLQCLCAKENGCSFLITNDRKFCDCGINVLTPEEFLKRVEKQI